VKRYALSEELRVCKEGKLRVKIGDYMGKWVSRFSFFFECKGREKK